MTTYAYDTSTHQLLAVWDTGMGAGAHTVARLNAATQETVGLHLAQALTRMSEAVWLSYVRPEIFDLPVSAAVQAMRRPHLPEAGLVRVEMHPVVDSAHRVGRELREVGSAGVTRAVIADVEEEMAAAGNAERGDLSARARQAVMLTRVAPSPAQIVEADRMLHEVPMCSPRLYTDVEPAAAGVAAIHWFLAAVSVMERLADTTGEGALDKAEQVEYFDSAVAHTVVRMVAGGRPDRTPLAIAQELLQMAVMASRGLLIAPNEPVQDGPCFTALDPARPARCLLDGLVGGIQALAALHATHLECGFDPGCDEVEWMEHARTHFDEAVRQEAAARAPERMAELVVATA
ncbi:hypothetical protein [Pseudonocardia kunmingensis]|uniref:Uncharacterized protein n=1 Tax=Pseudonocardia kunmingensis TaxID=630975 RepID=A0A543DI26_9PSEU|nr:hypothetical protein [Pseudonocardia kunmingensis]TQM08998.1 hypothetical protein FB558_4739 [Pseudonocardia kunmingensis]